MRVSGWMVCAALLTVVLAGCQQAPPPEPKPDLKAEEAKVLESDAAYLKAMQAKDAAAAAAVFADDGASYPSGKPKAAGRAAVEKDTVEFLKTPGLSLTWENSKVVVSQSGDLAYSTGSYTATMNDAKGKPVQEKGKFVTVWKKQADGSWKVAEDIANPDGPPAPVK